MALGPDSIPSSETTGPELGAQSPSESQALIPTLMQGAIAEDGR